MSAGASKNARLPEVQIQEHTHAGVAPSAPARYNRLIHFQGRSSVVEQRPFNPKVVGSTPTAPTNHPFSQQHLSDLSRRQKAAMRASRVSPRAPAPWKMPQFKYIDGHQQHAMMP